MAFFSSYSQQKQDHNVLTPASVSYVKKKKILESSLSLGVKTLLLMNRFESNKSEAINANPGFGAGFVCQYKSNTRFSLRSEPQFISVRYSQKNINYSISCPWLLNYHFKDHAYINFGVLPSLLFVDRSVLEKVSNAKGYGAVFELAGSFGVEYPIDQNLDLGVRIVTSFNKLLKKDLLDYQGISMSFTYFWGRYPSSENKLMYKKMKKVKTNQSRF